MNHAKNLQPQLHMKMKKKRRKMQRLLKKRVEKQTNKGGATESNRLTHVE